MLVSDEGAFLIPEEDEAYWQLVRNPAASRSPLTEEQREELAGIVGASRIRRETGRLLTSDGDAA